MLGKKRGHKRAVKLPIGKAGKMVKFSEKKLTRKERRGR